MTDPPASDWHAENQSLLMAEVGRIRLTLEAHLAGEEPPGREQVEPPALDLLSRALGLSAFERDLLLLAAGVELEASLGELCAQAQGAPERTYPTFGLALAALADGHWSGITPSGPLRHWLLIEVGPGNSLTASPLRIDEPVLHYLTGLDTSDDRLAGLEERVLAESDLVPSHRQIAEQLAETWRRTVGTPEFPVIQLCGKDSAGKRSIAAAGCDLLGLSLRRAQADSLPRSAADLERLMRLWDRTSTLNMRALLLDCDEMAKGDASREAAVARLVEELEGPLIITTRTRRPPKERPVLVLEVGRPTRNEQRAVWTDVLGERAGELEGWIDRLASQFDLSAPTIHAVYAGALGLAGDDSDDLGLALWRTCRAQVRPRMVDLAEHIEPSAGRAELILPAQQMATLGEITNQVRFQARVYDDWGFAEASSRGLGVSVLFAGPSGTGKTMAAEVLAGELDLDLFRIDLSSVVSKYIGETEKNLARLFDVAEEGGAILLFDEADALFGKRSEVQDSHDRFANIEISYLLQRIESYRGLAILTTNLRDALDTAFLRRLRFVVDFPFPAVAARREIWRSVLGEKGSSKDVDFDRLARLNLAGGSIRNVALNAAFLAAAEPRAEGIRMSHLKAATRQELLKMGKTAPVAEFEGWEVKA